MFEDVWYPLYTTTIPIVEFFSYGMGIISIFIGLFLFYCFFSIRARNLIFIPSQNQKRYLVYIILLWILSVSSGIIFLSWIPLPAFFKAFVFSFIITLSIATIINLSWVYCEKNKYQES